MSPRLRIDLHLGQPGASEPAPTHTAYVNEALRRLESLPQPRRVRITARGAAYALFGFPALIATSYYGWALVLWPYLAQRSQHALHGNEWLNLAVVAAFWWFLFDPSRRLVRDRALLATGSFTAGTIQFLANYHGYLALALAPNIKFRFPGDDGSEVTGSGCDYSGGVYLGMEVVVFYDGSRPRRSVIREGALWRLVDELNEP